MVWFVLAANTVGDDGSVLETFLELFPIELGETPFLGSEDLLTARELELGTTESFVGMSFMVVTDTDGHQWLTNTDTGDETCLLYTSPSPRDRG